MIDPPKHAANYGDRVRARDEKAREFLEGRTGFARAWSRFHLWLADTADGMYAFTHNEYLAGGIGAGVGFARGLFVGVPVAMLVALIVPSAIILPATLWMGAQAATMAFGSLIATGATIIASGFALQDGFTFYREARRDAVAENAGEVGDNIAKMGKAIAHDPVPVKAKAIERLKESHEIHAPIELPPPEKGDNHRYALAKRRAAELTESKLQR